LPVDDGKVTKRKAASQGSKPNAKTSKVVVPETQLLSNSDSDDFDTGWYKLRQNRLFMSLSTKSESLNSEVSSLSHG
jgi:hypothetical protein